MSTPTPGPPRRRPVEQSQYPRRVVIAFGLGLAMLVAGLLLVVLQLAGVEQVSTVGWLVVVLVAAVAGGLLTRVLVARLPVRQPPGT